MPMIEEMESTGNWLFRWRSYLPLFLMVLILASFSYFRYPFNSHRFDEVWELVCIGTGLLGLGIRVLTIGFVPRRTSGRNTSKQVAETLNTTGMYSIVRNPLYLGNFFMGLAVALFLRAWWLPLVYGLVFMLYYERIIFAEEAFLRRQFGDTYIEWASRTPAFVPRPSQWRKPDLPFSVRTVLRREYHGFFGLIISLFAVEQALELYMRHGWHVDPMWMWIMSLSAGFYLAIRLLSKTTSWLLVKGR